MKTKRSERSALKPPFPSAKAEMKNIGQEASYASAYQLAFLDSEFLLHKALRPVRLQLELLKPELLQQEYKIKSTIVVFGSARILNPEIAQDNLRKAKTFLKKHPNDLKAKRWVKQAKEDVKKSIYYEEAYHLSKLVSEYGQKNHRRDFVIVTGGGPGIMEAANQGAHEVNAKSIGLNIVLPHEQAPNPYVSPELCFRFHYFAIRKMHFLIRARALVCFPGGYGTLDELFEALTLLQTKKIKPIPLLLFNKTYWTRLIDFKFLVTQGMISRDDIKLFHYVETAQDAWKIIARFYHLD
jgi:uncharacterized protein (TIGR00730 family)